MSTESSVLSSTYGIHATTLSDLATTKAALLSNPKVTTEHLFNIHHHYHQKPVYKEDCQQRDALSLTEIILSGFAQKRLSVNDLRKLYSMAFKDFHIASSIFSKPYLLAQFTPTQINNLIAIHKEVAILIVTQGNEEVVKSPQKQLSPSTLARISYAMNIHPTAAKRAVTGGLAAKLRLTSTAVVELAKRSYSLANAIVEKLAQSTPGYPQLTTKEWVKIAKYGGFEVGKKIVENPLITKQFKAADLMEIARYNVLIALTIQETCAEQLGVPGMKEMQEFLDEELGASKEREDSLSSSNKSRRGSAFFDESSITTSSSRTDNSSADNSSDDSSLGDEKRQTRGVF